MTLGDIAKGKWLRHPLHPILVHIPVAVWPAALIFDVLSQLGVGGNALVRLSFFCISFGLAAALLAVPTGVIDWAEIKQERPAWKIGLYHMAVNLVVALVYAINLGLRLERFDSAEAVGVMPLILSIAGTVLLAGGAYLGGLMVFDHGIGVARMSKQELRKAAQRGGANLPPEK